MQSQVIAMLMARELTRRRIAEPVPEPRPRAPRRTAARALHAMARRLDPGVTARPHLGR
jgi:hypothetical protein